MKYKLDTWDYVLIGVTAGMLALGTLAHYKSSDYPIRHMHLESPYPSYEHQKEAERTPP